jgi:hypothetical protein
MKNRYYARVLCTGRSIDICNSHNLVGRERFGVLIHSIPVLIRFDRGKLTVKLARPAPDRRMVKVCPSFDGQWSFPTDSTYSLHDEDCLLISFAALASSNPSALATVVSLILQPVSNTLVAGAVD